FHTPEIKRLAHAQLIRVAAAASHAHPAHQPVHEAAYSPGPVKGRPAALAAHAGERAIDGRRRRAHRLLAPFDEHPLLQRKEWRFTIALAAAECVAPDRLDVSLANSLQRPLHGRAIVRWLD